MVSVPLLLLPPDCCAACSARGEWSVTASDRAAVAARKGGTSPSVHTFASYLKRTRPMGGKRLVCLRRWRQPAAQVSTIGAGYD